EGAGGLTGADHVHVERAEDLLVSAQRIREGAALVDPLLDVGEHALEALLLHLLHQRRQTVDQGDAGPEEGGELAGDDGDVRGRDAAAGQLAQVDVAPGDPLARGPVAGPHDVGEEDAVLAQLCPQGLGRVRLEQAADVLPGLREALVFEHGHGRASRSPETGYRSSCVTVRTSATAVSPVATLRAPSSRRVNMPLAMAAFLMVLLSTFSRTRRRISSSTSRNSYMPVRPRTPFLLRVAQPTRRWLCATPSAQS